MKKLESNNLKNEYKGWSLNKEDWTKVRDTTIQMKLDWNLIPLRKSLSELVPQSKGIYMICGKAPTHELSPYLNFRTPLYIGESSTNLRNRFSSHCKGELQGVRKIISNWVPDSLEFIYSEISEIYSEQSIDSLIYDFETILMEAFRPAANIKKQNISKFNMTG
jgi:hypothetical protein